MSLCASLEHDFSGLQLRNLVGTWTNYDYPLLTPATLLFAITVRDVADALTTHRGAVVEEMAKSTWSSWSDHHEQIRSWLESRID
jgi:hypothetical protein